MKQVHTNLKKGEIKVLVENKDDLWYLSHIIDPKDSVKGKTFRKIKIGEGTDRNIKVVKKPVFIRIAVEKVEFSTDAQSLRVSGKVVEGTEDVPSGVYHTFDIDENTTITIIKDKWLKYQIDKVKEASSSKPPKILLDQLLGFLHLIMSSLK